MAIGFSIALSLIFVASFTAQAATYDSYRLSPGDKIGVKVFGEPDLSVEGAQVFSNGTINLPLLGQVRVEGMTTGALERQLTLLYSDGYLRNPKVTVILVEYRPFYISGAVSRPGAFQFKEGMTVAKAVVLAGGFSENAKEDDLKLRRLAEEGEIVLDATIDSEILPGDVVIIGSRTVVGLVFYVHGEVARPGAYPFSDNLTVEKAITLAGGFGKRASKRKIEIVRDSDPERKSKRVNLNDQVEPGDVINVGTSLF